ncbi:helix-turn-helix domain-containing protein [Streptomyces althioticus]|uniref:helix-turn-helix domain-containing protein n=1 Tax=Streptomyces althioticus TaxID=83380 RepID=UPI002F906AE5
MTVVCRPEKPLTTSNKALRELQEWLREHRSRTRQGYRALAVRAGCHPTTLQRAASGDTVPKLQTVLNYARACDAPPEEARLLWRRARYEQTRQARGGRGLPAPRPEFIRDFVDLSAAVQDLYEKAGSPPLRTLEQRAGGFGVLPRSTAHRIVTKQAMPHSLQQFQAYLRACEVPEADWPDWEAAWTRAWRHEKNDDVALQSLIRHEQLREAMEKAKSDMGRLTQRVVEQVTVVVDGKEEVVLSRNGTYRRLLPTQRSQPRTARRRPAQASRLLPGRPVQGQLAIPIGEPEAEAPALF